MVSNVTGAPVCGADLFGREYEMTALWRRLERGEHILMVAPRRVGKSSLMQELRRAPKPNWTVFYSDLENGHDAGDLFSELLAQIAGHPATRTLLEAAAGKVPFRSQIGELFGRLKIEQLDVGVARVELKAAMADGWEDTAEQLKSRLATQPDSQRILFILDELPILISHIIRDQGPQQALDLLAWLRSIRQDGALSRKVCFVVAGSIGLHAVLRRHNMSGPINDFSPFIVEPWERATAEDFLRHLGTDDGFSLTEDHIAEMLNLLGDPIPYHLQLFFSAARDQCRDQPAKLDTAALHRAFRSRLAGPTGTPALNHYAERLETLLDDEHRPVAMAILDACCRARDGVPQGDLAGRFPEHPALNPVLRLLQEDGYLAEEQGRLAFRSNLLREFWATNHRGGA